MSTIWFYGTVKFFSVRGFYFIQRDDDRPDIFGHASEIVGAPADRGKALLAGERVKFRIKQGPRGLEAAEVSVVDSAIDGNVADPDDDYTDAPEAA